MSDLEFLDGSVELDRPRRSTVTPAELYLASLNTWQSRKAARDSLQRITRILKKPDWQTLPWEKLTAQETTYVRAIVVRDSAAATARLTISVLRGVLRQAFRLGLMDAEAFQRAIDLPRIQGSSPAKGRALAEEEIKKLSDYIATIKDPRGSMVNAVFAAALGGGLRREELATLRAGALSADGAFLNVAGKGKRARLQKLPPWAGEAIRRWLALRVGLGLTTDRLFVQGQGGGPFVADAPMKVKDVWYLVTETGQRAGITHFTPHDLRRTFATRMLEIVDLSQTQKLMGHSDVSTTIRYDKREATAANKAVDSLPGWGFDRPSTKPAKEKPVLKATIGEALAQKKAPPVGPGGRAAPATPKESVDERFEKSTLNAEVSHPVTGQRLVNRRVVKKADYLRHGRPADLAWLIGQAKTLAGMGVSVEKIAGALVRTGVRRGDGSDVGAEDVSRWVGA